MSALAKPRLYSGPDATRALEKIRQTHANQEAWPYPHVYPPVNSIPVNETNSVVTDVLTSTSVILTYKVPTGFKFIMNGCILGYINAGGLGAFVPGQALWTVKLNSIPGVTNIQASPVQGLTLLKMPLGNFLTGHIWYFSRAYEFAPLDVLRATAQNIGLGVGDPNYFTAAFVGWLVPALPNAK